MRECVQKQQLHGRCDGGVALPRAVMPDKALPVPKHDPQEARHATGLQLSCPVMAMVSLIGAQRCGLVS